MMNEQSQNEQPVSINNIVRPLLVGGALGATAMLTGGASIVVPVVNGLIYGSAYELYRNRQALTAFGRSSWNSLMSCSTKPELEIEDEGCQEQHRRDASPIRKDRRSNTRCLDDLQPCLEKYKTYACSDAKTYRHCIAEGKEDEVINRYKKKPTHHVQLEAQANSTMADPLNFQYSRFAIKKVAGLINQAKSGCCTTLAMSLLHELLERHPMFRFQMVASHVEQGTTAHCFVRAMDDHGQVRIMDPWLVTLGWDGFFTQDNYPFRQYLEDLQVCFDSKKQSELKRSSIG